jgi:hypothetical protein
MQIMKRRIVRIITRKDGIIKDIAEWQDTWTMAGEQCRTVRGKFFDIQQRLFDQAIEYAANGYEVSIEAEDKD